MKLEKIITKLDNYLSRSTHKIINPDKIISRRARIKFLLKFLLTLIYPTPRVSARNNFICILISFFLPGIIFAQSVVLKARYSTYQVGDVALVNVVVNSGGQNINTVSGTINLPSGISVSEIRSGSSVISLWVNKPVVNGNKITFTGGMPGGFSGNGQLFSFLVSVKKQGNLSFSFSDTHVLLNDGTGNEISGLKLIPLAFSVSGSESKSKSKPASVQTSAKSGFPADTIPPESFIPLIGHDPSIANNAYFVSFNAVDKDSGIASYQVREAPAIFSIFSDMLTTNWQDAQSPYILKYQYWGSTVFVKAIDNAGNSTIAKAEKPFSSFTLIVLIAILVLVSVCSGRVMRVVRRGQRKTKRFK